MPTSPIAILCPVYNDWAAFDIFLRELKKAMGEEITRYHVFAVDDGSTDGGSTDGGSTEKQGQLFDPGCPVEIIRLRRNLGHQRAIAVGLCYLEKEKDFAAVVVMDCDGEDSPHDIQTLVLKCEECNFEKVVFAQRRKRQESFVFQFCYRIYLWVYYIVAGKTLKVGNFSIVPASRLASIVTVSEIWIHYAASVYKSRQPIETVPIDRSNRYHGQSKMNFVGLVIHGLSALAVNADVIGVRTILLSLVVVTACSIAGVVALAMKLFTDLATPGWATSVIGLSLVMLIQFVTLSVVFSFIILNNRQATNVIPTRDYSYYILDIKS